MQLVTLEQIRNVLTEIDLIKEMEEGFRAYSAKQATIPPVGELLLEKGEVHIKYGYVKGEEYYVIKVASGFYGNSELGLPSGNGLMIIFKQDTGEIACILLDEGHLTDVRTAAAGAVAAKHLAPPKVERIGIVGTGIQARLQLSHLKDVVGCREALVWGRGDEQLTRYVSDMSQEGFEIRTTTNASEVAQTCKLIVTTTPSKSPLLDAADILPGTHITAVGSDTAAKQELDFLILAKADFVVADSIPQCLERGEIYQAISAGVIKEEELLELGDVITGRSKGRTNGNQITIADLTGVAVQDIKIASAVFSHLR